MRVLKQIIEKGSVIEALNEFTIELNHTAIQDEDVLKMQMLFKEAYEKYGDYDKARGDINNTLKSVIQKSTFKYYWEANISKSISTGDYVQYLGVRYYVQDIQENYNDTENLYTLFNAKLNDDNTLVNIKGLKLLARSDELIRV